MLPCSHFLPSLFPIGRLTRAQRQLVCLSFVIEPSTLPFSFGIVILALISSRGAKDPKTSGEEEEDGSEEEEEERENKGEQDGVPELPPAASAASTDRPPGRAVRQTSSLASVKEEEEHTCDAHAGAAHGPVPDAASTGQGARQDGSPAGEGGRARLPAESTALGSSGDSVPGAASRVSHGADGESSARGSGISHTAGAQATTRGQGNEQGQAEPAGGSSEIETTNAAGGGGGGGASEGGGTAVGDAVVLTIQADGSQAAPASNEGRDDNDRTGNKSQQIRDEGVKARGVAGLDPAGANSMADVVVDVEAVGPPLQLQSQRVDASCAGTDTRARCTATSDAGNREVVVEEVSTEAEREKDAQREERDEVESGKAAAAAAAVGRVDSLISEFGAPVSLRDWVSGNRMHHRLSGPLQGSVRLPFALALLRVLTPLVLMGLYVFLKIFPLFAVNDLMATSALRDNRKAMTGSRSNDSPVLVLHLRSLSLKAR